MDERFVQFALLLDCDASVEVHGRCLVATPFMPSALMIGSAGRPNVGAVKVVPYAVILCPLKSKRTRMLSDNPGVNPQPVLALRLQEGETLKDIAQSLDSAVM